MYASVQEKEKEYTTVIFRVIKHTLEAIYEYEIISSLLEVCL